MLLAMLLGKLYKPFRRVSPSNKRISSLKIFLDFFGFPKRALEFVGEEERYLLAFH